MDTKPYDIPNEVKRLLLDRLVDDQGSRVLLIPRAIEEGTAIYQDSHIYAAKDLRANGVDASFLVESENRTFVSEFSHDIVYQLAIGIASNLGWDGVKAIWTFVRAQCEGLAPSGEVPRVRLQVAKLKKGNTDVEGLTLEGPATKEMLKVLAAFLAEDEPDN